MTTFTRKRLPVKPIGFVRPPGYVFGAGILEEPKPTRRHAGPSPADHAWKLGHDLALEGTYADPPLHFGRDEQLAFERGWDEGRTLYEAKARDEIEAQIAAIEATHTDPVAVYGYE